jgi:hypothetical protein
MKKWIRPVCLVLLSVVVAVWLSGCKTQAQTGALVGGAVGAGAGGLIGDTKGAVIGGAVGAGAGYLYGRHRDRQADNGNGDVIIDENGDYEDDIFVENGEVTEAIPPDYSEDYGVNAENTVVVNVTNTDGSTTPVRLVQQGDVWVGPRGERYDMFPTEEQLRQRYGF